MKDLKNAAEVKAAANKKPYVKPDFEVIDLEETPKLLAASGESKPTDGGVGTNGLNIFNL
ncbi:MAG: hypothetical protein IKO99_09660 [Bacteroidales bacterium]|nr:hypothetical protein [Bacteroidales bacterium]